MWISRTLSGKKVAKLNKKIWKHALSEEDINNDFSLKTSL